MREWPPCPLLQRVRIECRQGAYYCEEGVPRRWSGQPGCPVLLLVLRAPPLDVQRPPAARAGGPRHGERRDRAVPHGPAARAAHGVLPEPLAVEAPAIHLRVCVRRQVLSQGKTRPGAALRPRPRPWRPAATHPSSPTPPARATAW